MPSSIGKKALLISNLTKKEVGKKIKLAGIQEGIKKITTKKGDTMAILFLEDPTGKIEVTLFPRTYAEVAQILETPDTFLVIEGVLDLRAGQLQLRADTVKHTTLSRIIDNAKESGFYDEEAAKRGAPIMSSPKIEEEIELVDEEGNVIAGETVTLQAANETDDFVGPLSKWIMEGMQTEDILKAVGISEADAPPSSGPKEKAVKEESETEEPSVIKINIYTIELPARAPKKMLLDLKTVLEKFPGKEKVQLKIGEQTVPLPLTINSSTVLEQKVEELLQRYESPVS